MPQVINLNDTTPAAPANHQNLPWKADAVNPDPSVSRNVSVSVPVMDATHGGIVPTPPNDGTKYLAGDATYKPLPSSGGVAFQSRQLEVIVYGNQQGSPNELGTVTGPRACGDAITVANGSLSSDFVHTSYGAGTTLVTSGTGTAAFMYGGNIYRVGRNLKILGKIWLTRITDVRFKFGLNANPQVDSDTTLDDLAGFRFSTIAGDTHYKCVTGDGSTLTVTDSGVAPVANVQRTFAIIFDDVTPSVKFYIDGTLVATNTTNLPRLSPAQDLAYSLGIRGNSSNNTVGFGQMIIATDY